ncbi:RNA-directed DNA polymerase, eukaryota, nucleotide-binding alpha-beta plait domain protein [Tanacetum coccineum]
MEDDVDINRLIMKQYLAWVQDDIRPGMVKPKIGNDVEFEINSNFMRELRRKLFKGTHDEDAHEHVRRVLEITDLFHFLGVTHDAVMLRVFPITLKGPALRWINRILAGLVTTWDLLEKAFIRQYCPPLKTTKKLEIIRNFKQEMDETLYHAWEMYNDLLVLDSKGFIPLMKPTQALISIQVMAEHSHNCFKNCEGAHLTMDYPLEKEDKAVEQNKYMRSLEETIIKFYEDSITKQAADNEWIRKFNENTDSNKRAIKTSTKNLEEKAYQLTQTVLTNTGEKVKGRTTMGKENVKEPVPCDLPVDQTYVPLA